VVVGLHAATKSRAVSRTGGLADSEDRPIVPFDRLTARPPDRRI
jgi:hypothetical protein